MKAIYWIIFFFTACVNCIYATDKYKQITNTSGLSNSSINTIYQDSSKIIWVGTWDGLNSYDGKDIHVFKLDPNNTESISNNIIWDIIEQKKGVLWIATDYGINRMNTYTRSFTRYPLEHETGYSIYPRIFISKSKDNTVFSAAYEIGVSYFDETENKFRDLNIPEINCQDIRIMGLDGKDNIWLLHQNGIVDMVEWIRDEKDVILSKNCTAIDLPPIAILKTTRDYVIAMDYNKKVYVFDVQSKKKIYEYGLMKIIPNADIVELDIIDQTLYVSSSSGSYYTLSLDNFSKPEFNSSFQGTIIRSFYKCSQDILWLGTDGDGIYKIYSRNTLFETVKLKKEMNIIRSFCEDNSGRLWVATKGGGIAVLQNDAGGKYQMISEYNVNNGLLHNYVYTIAKGFDGSLFIGTDGKGINIFSDNKLSSLDLSKVSFDFSNIYAIYCSEKDSTLWIGTSGSGLIKLKIKKKNGRFEAIAYKQYLHDKKKRHSISNNVIFSIIPANENSLWIATRGGGLNYFDIENEEFKSYIHNTVDTGSISSNDILCLQKDNDGDLWIGTSAGLNQLKISKEKNLRFKRYNQSNGLPNNTVHGIIEDNEGEIWVSTNNGLSKINKKTNQIISYYQQNGLQNNEFTDGAYYKSPSNGYLFFGGIAGFNVFNPDNISLSDYIPSFYISSFKIFNEEEYIYDRITKNTSNEDELILNYNENFLSFNFLALDYVQNENCEYRYMLEGIDKSWVYNQNIGFATYSNIPPGEYIFIVYYTNSDKVWMKEPYRLNIIIGNPYWLSTWAYLVYFLILGGLLSLSFVFIRKKINKRRNLLIERLKQKEQENIHEAKLRFFTNIAHELYTPITLIYGPCEKILEHKNKDEYIEKYTKVIKSNAERMKLLISELMEFRKVSAGHRQIALQRVNVSELVYSVSDNFVEIAENNKIDFKLNISKENLFWISDWNALEKIIFNLISNAFKYTYPNGYIYINIKSDNEKMYLCIVNSGKGIKPENIDKIFNRFKILDDFENQIEKGNSGRNGIGLALTKSLVTLLKGDIHVESILEKDTTFTVELPLLANENNKEMGKQGSSLPPKDEIRQIPSGSNGSPLILIIDDEKEIRELIRDTLYEKYNNIIEASNGVEALQMMKTKRPNLIICDIIMPEMDGLEFIKQIKNNIFTKHLPIIILSAKSSIEDQISATEKGSDVYITKPFNPKHIFAAVENVLTKHKLIEEYYNSSAMTYELLENGKFVEKEDKELLTKLIDFIEHNVEKENLSPSFISESLGIGKMTLYHKTKDLLEMAPSELIRTIKMKEITHLLISTNYTIQEIMFKCGYNNKSHFYREFMKKYNMTPKEYRNNHTI